MAGACLSLKTRLQEARPAPEIMVARWLHVLAHDLARGGPGVKAEGPPRQGISCLDLDHSGQTVQEWGRFVG